MTIAVTLTNLQLLFKNEITNTYTYGTDLVIHDYLLQKDIKLGFSVTPTEALETLVIGKDSYEKAQITFIDHPIHTGESNNYTIYNGVSSFIPVEDSFTIPSSNDLTAFSKKSSNITEKEITSLGPISFRVAKHSSSANMYHIKLESDNITWSGYIPDANSDKAIFAVEDVDGLFVTSLISSKNNYIMVSMASDNLPNIDSGYPLFENCFDIVITEDSTI